MMSPGRAAVGTAPLLAAYGPPFGFCRGGLDASREDSDAPCARSASFEDRRDFRQRDRPTAGSGAVDRPTDTTAAGDGGLGWPLPELTDAALEARLFTAVGTKQGHRRHSEPDWVEVHRELKRKHVTLQILWDEYIERCPDGYRYSRFCELYRNWASRLSLTMRQTHAGGDKLFVDYAGDTVPVIIDRLSGKTRPAQIFVAVLGASNFTYAGSQLDAGPRRLDRCPHQGLCRHRRRAQAAGAGQHQGPGHQGLPLRAAGQSQLRRDGGALRHGDPAGTAAPAARQGQGRGRGADYRALAIRPPAPSPLYSLSELNAAIGELLRQLNDERPLRRLGVTRRILLEELDRPNLKELPAEPYCFAE